MPASATNLHFASALAVRGGSPGRKQSMVEVIQGPDAHRPDDDAPIPEQAIPGRASHDQAAVCGARDLLTQSRPRAMGRPRPLHRPRERDP